MHEHARTNWTHYWTSHVQLKDKPFVQLLIKISPLDDSQHLLFLHLMGPSVLAGETYTFESKH